MQMMYMISHTHETKCARFLTASTFIKISCCIQSRCEITD